MKIEKLQIYRCQICGNMVEVVSVGGGTLVCCGQEMTLLQENTTDASQEKHVPVWEKTKEGVQVSVGSVLHPMEEQHYIQFIEVITETRVLRRFLKPGEEPKAFFPTDEKVVKVREYCNLHGLWATL